MSDTIWEVGDEFRRDGVWTVVQAGPDDGLAEGELLIGRWYVREGTRIAGYKFTNAATLARSYVSKREKRDTSTGPKFTITEAKRLYKEADAAGMEALRAATPTPMLVYTPKDLMGSILPGGDDGGIDETQPTYFVNDGACGFAWITIYPGNGSLANRWKKLGYASPAYGGGVQVWVHQGNQSIAKKEAYAGAFARVVEAAGVKAYSGSRMD